MTRIVHVSDLHFGAHDEVLVEALSECLVHLEPSVIAASGDLTQRGTHREFAAMAQFFSRFACPKIIAPGNHDMPLFNLPARMLRPFRRFEHYTGGDVSRYRDDKTMILTLNTARGVQLRANWALGAVKMARVDDMLARFEDAASGAARVVVCHHPLHRPVAAPMHAPTLRGPRAAAALTHGAVDLILSGHMHHVFAERLPFGDRMTYAVGAGTAFSTRTRAHRPSFNVIEVTASALIVTPYFAEASSYRPEHETAFARRARPVP